MVPGIDIEDIVVSLAKKERTAYWRSVFAFGYLNKNGLSYSIGLIIKCLILVLASQC